MPSVSISQQRLMGQAYAVKKGKLKIDDVNPKYRDKIKKLSKNMTMKQLKDFASTPHKKKNGEYLPKYVESFMPTFESFVYESKMAKHTKIELKLENIFEDEDNELNIYNKAIANAVIKLMSASAKQKDSGFSASMVREIFDRLSNQQNLTPITKDSNQWIDTYEIGNEPNILWQNKRNPTIFSKDGGKTWFNINEIILGYVEACLESLILNPGMNLIGMGPVKFPDNAGTTSAFHSQNIGSGDMPVMAFDLEDNKDEKKKKKKKIKNNNLS